MAQKKGRYSANLSEGASSAGCGWCRCCQGCIHQAKVHGIQGRKRQLPRRRAGDACKQATMRRQVALRQGRRGAGGGRPAVWWFKPNRQLGRPAASPF